MYLHTQTHAQHAWVRRLLSRSDWLVTVAGTWGDCHWPARSMVCQGWLSVRPAIPPFTVSCLLLKFISRPTPASPDVRGEDETFMGAGVYLIF